MKYVVTFKPVEAKAITLDAENPAKAIKQATKLWKTNTEPEFQSIEVKAE